VNALDTARFWSKVEVKGKNDCWIWRAGRDGSGYGSFRITESKTEGAHRVAYSIFANLEIDDLAGTVVRHSCDNPCCCNPFHLSTGTHVDNVMDRVGRKRSAKGEGNGHHVLTESEVISIMADSRPNSAIAKDYGVHTDTVRCIKIGKTWKHLFQKEADESSNVRVG